MRNLIILILLIISNQDSIGQTFLESFKKYRLDKVAKISKPQERKKFQKLIKYQLIEFDTIFTSYKAHNGFDFNKADTLFLIYYASLITPFTYQITIWSGKDTISYKQGLEMTDSIKPFKYKRIITYQPMIPKFDNSEGFAVITEKDSLITLVSKRDFTAINHLSDNETISDGGYYLIYVAIKDVGHYKFETCSPNQFLIPDTYRKK